MPRVDFYILSQPNSRDRFACDLAAKLFKQSEALHIHTESRDEARRLDELLWTFRDTSFLPHALIDDKEATQSLITLGWPGVTAAHNSVMMNLALSIPENANEFERVLEIVPGDDSAKQQARQRYREYRERGYSLHNHDIEN